MPVYSLGSRTPKIHPDAYVHPDAVVIGDVTIGSLSSIWPSAVLRGDYGTIVIGERTSIQDGAVVHAVSEFPTLVGSDVVVGHLAHLEGCTIHDGSLVGSGSIVLHRAHVHTGATVGAGAVVTNDQIIPEDALAVGVPAKIREGQSSRDLIAMSAAVYVDNAKRYAAELRQIN
jgi:carbonic anhydrase/acetyltransferase-like protein (isoleucine patch superfamily)